MKASVTVCRDPFRPANRRTVNLVRRRRSLRSLAPKTSLPTICQLNGKWISRQSWNRRVQDGDAIVFVTLPQGGGGSNPLRVILMLAVMVAAPYAGSAILGINGAAALGSFGVSAFNAAIGFAGAALVNALVPAPKIGAAQHASSLASASPTYSLGAQGNQARVGQPIPVIYGRHLIYPDFAAMPYTEYAGNEQYLYQLLCIGQGEYDIETIRIEDTPTSGFDEIETEVVPPGGSVTLFPTRVITSIEVSGQEALTSTALGPFVANDAGTDASALAVDVVMPRGMYYANDDGGLSPVTIAWTVQAQEIDDDGVAIGSWVTLGTHSKTLATSTPQRYSYKYGVAKGRYQVKLTRTDTKQTDSRYGHELAWYGLRAYLPGAQTYGDVTIVAMKMRASNNLSAQASRKVNMIVTRKLPTWHPDTGWSASNVATRSIAWALADIGRADYGGKLPDSRIDLQALYDLDAVWSARADTFDAVFDSQSTIAESLAITARAGRAIWFQQGGIVHVVRDGPVTVPVAMFSQRNIIKGSLKIDYVMPSEATADCVDVEYFDADVWKWRTVRATLPGGTSVKPAAVKLTGVTSRAQAWREGMYTAACNKYRRRMPSFASEMDGFIPTLGDLVAVQHDLPRWGQSGEIVDWVPATKTATVSEPLDWSAGGAHVLAFRGRDGSSIGPFSATAGADAYHVVLSDWALAGATWTDGTTDKHTPDTASTRERSHYAFGPANTQYIKCRLLAMTPKSSETAALDCVVESDYVHTAETGDYPTATAWQLPSQFTSPLLLGLTARSMPDDLAVMLLSWQPAPGAEHYLIEQSNGDGSWVRCGETSAASYTVRAIYASATLVRVAGVGLTRGPWIQINYAGVADYMWVVGDDTDTMWVAGDDTAIMW